MKLEPQDAIALDAITSLAQEHGMEKAIEIVNLGMEMVDAVKKKHGEIDEIALAVEFLYQLVVKAKCQTSKNEP
jgi:hypothetical protein